MAAKESKYSLKLAATDAYSAAFGDFSKKSKKLSEQIQGQQAELKKLNGQAKQLDGFERLTGQLGKTEVALQGAREQQARLSREQVEAKGKAVQLAASVDQAAAAIRRLEGATGTSTAELKAARSTHLQLAGDLNRTEAAVRKLDTQQDKATASVRNLTASQRTERTELGRLETALQAAGLDTSKLSEEQKRLERATEGANAALQSQRAKLAAVGSAQKRIDGNRAARADLRGQLVETAATAYVATRPITQAWDMESAMADVAKVLPFEDGEREAMASANLKMAGDRLIASAGLTGVDLAKIEYAAGQSGIGADAKTSGDRQAEVIDFTRTAAIMAAAFDTDAQTSGETMAGWRASMKLDQGGAVNLADATNHVGNNLNAKAADVASVVKRYGAVGTAAGLKPEQVAALAGAFLNPGTEKEIAGTGFKNFTAALTKGDASTKGQTEAWDTLGFDPKDLAVRMQQDAPSTIMDVLKTLRDQPVEEQSALATQLFGSESIGSIQPLLTNLEAVDKAFALVSDRAKYTGSMMKEAEGVANTGRTGWNVFTASILRLSTVVGQAVLPAVNAALVPLTGLANVLADGAEKFPVLTTSITAAAAGLVALKVGALGLKFAGLMVGQAFNRGGLARAKLDATTARTAATADGAVARLNAVMARMGMGGPGVGDAGGKAGRKGRTGVRGAGLVGKIAVPLMVAGGVAQAASALSEGDSEGVGGAVGSTAGGLGGMYAGAAAGAAIGTVVPVVGNVAGGIIGGAVGGLAGAGVGEWLGEKLGALVDRLSSPDAMKEEVTNNNDNRAITFSPVLNLTPTGDPAYDQRLANQVMAKLRGEFVPLMMANPATLRSGASLTDGGSG